MAKLKEPSVRARKYIMNKSAGMSDYQAAIKAGYSPATAKNAAVNVEKQGVKTAIAELLEAKGLTTEKIAELISTGAQDANRIHGTGDNFIEVPDHSARVKYLEMGVKLHDLYPSDKLDLTTKGQPLGVTIDTKPNEVQ